MSGRCNDLATVPQKQPTMLVRCSGDVAMDWYDRLEKHCASWIPKESFQQADRLVDMLLKEEVVGNTYQLAPQIVAPEKDKSNSTCRSEMTHRANWCRGIGMDVAALDMAPWMEAELDAADAAQHC